MSEWLDNLKTGDEVALFTGYVHRVPTIRRVTRTTATMILVGGMRFRRRDGVQVGGGYSAAAIAEPTQERRDLAEERTLRHMLDDVVRSPETDLSTLRAMAFALRHAANGGSKQ